MTEQKNRKRLGVTLIVVAVVVVAAATVFLGTSDKNTNRVLVASGHPEWAPIMYQTGDTISGAGPALVAKIFGDLGVQTSFPYEGTWDQVQAKAQSGAVDALVAAYKTDARQQYMAYSESYTIDPIVLFVKSGNQFAFQKNADLIGKKGVGTIGDSYGQTFDDFITANDLSFQRVDTAQEGFDLVLQGKADYFIYSLYAGDTELKKEARNAGLVSLPHEVAEENFYITISKKSPFLKYLPQINALIEKYKADGTIDQLIQQAKNSA